MALWGGNRLWCGCSLGQINFHQPLAFDGHRAHNSRMGKLDFDDTDYSVVVKNRAPPPNSWRWEIYRAGRSSPLGLSPVLFRTMAAVNKAGKRHSSSYWPSSAFKHGFETSRHGFWKVCGMRVAWLSRGGGLVVPASTGARASARPARYDLVEPPEESSCRNVSTTTAKI